MGTETGWSSEFSPTTPPLPTSAVPVMTLDERVAVIEACRFVDEVIQDAPLRLTEAFLDQHSITAVVHGDDLSPEGAESVYGPAVAAGKLVFVRRAEGISTTQLIQRVLDAADPRRDWTDRSRV